MPQNEMERLKEQEALEQPEPRLDPVDEVVNDEQEAESKPLLITGQGAQMKFFAI